MLTMTADPQRRSYSGPDWQTLSTHCPRCGRRLVLPLSPDLDSDSAKRLARFVLCDRCTAGQHTKPEHREPPAARLPYADD